MDKYEALKLALDDLIAEYHMETSSFAKRVDEIFKQARSAPVQEPVAWMGIDIEGNPNKFRLNPFNGGVELYKKPQSVKVWDAEGYDALMQELELWKAAAKRPWFGLTPEDYKDIFKAQTCERVVQLAEAKLKEKNNA